MNARRRSRTSYSVRAAGRIAESRVVMEKNKHVRVLRVYHGGRLAAHRERERALVNVGVEVSLALPQAWPQSPEVVSEDSFETFELEVAREGDVNRHRYRSIDALRKLLLETSPDVLDVHEEPFSVASRQWLAAAPVDMPVVMYTAQNIDKRLPPPFAQFERSAYARVAALYPCSAQAASVARGKGFAGLVEVLPLGYDDALFFPGSQSLNDDELVLGLFGRLVPEKGIADAMHVLARLRRLRPTRLVIVGSGPEEARARSLAAALGVADCFELIPWQSTSDLASMYRDTHVVLVPSRVTETWAEQFGRVIVEAQASGAVVAGYSSGSISEVAGDAAVLTTEGAVVQLGDRIVELVSDQPAYVHHRERGIALARTRTWSHVAARQADLYRKIAAGDTPRLKLQRSPKRRREAARAEFGRTAATTAGPRPFALPFLRRGGAVAFVHASTLDAAGELKAGFHAWLDTAGARWRSRNDA